MAAQADNKARKLDRAAAKQEDRALKMSRKIGRGGRRSAKAAQTAVGLRQAAERQRERGLQSDRWGSAPAPAPDPVERLARLAALRDQGALTEEEFQKLKAEILGGSA